jgi:hypothetical protein
MFSCFYSLVICHFNYLLVVWRTTCIYCIYIVFICIVWSRPWFCQLASDLLVRIFQDIYRWQTAILSFRRLPSPLWQTYILLYHYYRRKQLQKLKKVRWRSCIKTGKKKVVTNVFSKKFERMKTKNLTPFRTALTNNLASQGVAPCLTLPQSLVTF